MEREEFLDMCYQTWKNCCKVVNDEHLPKIDREFAQDLGLMCKKYLWEIKD